MGRYVVSCQVFGKMQKSKKKADLDKAAHIKMLARIYPGLRIAHVDEKHGEFYSVLSKNAGNGTDDMEEEYRVRVSGGGRELCVVRAFSLVISLPLTIL